MTRAGACRPLTRRLCLWTTTTVREAAAFSPIRSASWGERGSEREREGERERERGKGKKRKTKKEIDLKGKK